MESRALLLLVLACEAEAFGPLPIARVQHDQADAHAPVPRRALLTALPALTALPLPALQPARGARALAAAENSRDAEARPLVGYRATTVEVGGENIPVAQWYPLDEPSATTEAKGGTPYVYRIGIANLFKAFLGLRLPIPSPVVRSGGAHVRVGNVPAASTRGGIVFAHGMLGSRFDMATLCEALAREGFVVSAADFAESISGSFTPNPQTSRGAIIEAEIALLRRDFGAERFGIFGHSAGGGSATMTQVSTC